jgi:hypothetical protein
MLQPTFPLIAVVIAGLTIAVQPASAQATRTWVSGVGNDANPCSRTAPCKTFAGAISKTAAGGEINALDPGGYGAVTITKSIAIDGGSGQVASVLAAGTNGIIINAGANDVVTLRNIEINGVNGTPTPGLNGIRFLAGSSLVVENVRIFGFSQSGIDINLNTASAVRVMVTDTIVSNSATGIFAKNAGSGRLTVSAQRVSLLRNSTVGFKGDSTTGSAAIFCAISDSMAAGNATGIHAAGGPAGGVLIQITRSSVVNNVNTGVLADGSATSVALLSNTLVSGNGTGLASAGGAQLDTYKNNSVNGNTTDGTFTTQITPQ